jgi:hypothetical protein
MTESLFPPGGFTPKKTVGGVVMDEADILETAKRERDRRQQCLPSTLLRRLSTLQAAPSKLVSGILDRQTIKYVQDTFGRYISLVVIMIAQWHCGTPFTCVQ